MKKLRKLMAFVITAAMCMAMAVPAMAAVESGESSITIKRDSTYTEGDGSTTQTGNETYTYYRILFADIDTLDDVTESTGALAETREGKVAYYVTAEAQATALKNLKVKNGNNEDVSLFTVTPSASGTRHNVILAYEEATAAEIAAALDTVKDSFPNATVTRRGDADVEIEDIAAGYYLITSSLGSKLAVQTLGDVTIKEKNTYPTVDKKQDDAATPTYADDVVHVKVGDTIYYSVDVKVPATANGKITVTDALSAGLTYDSATALTWSVNTGSITENTDYKVLSAGAGETWKAEINATDATKGKTITIKYQATVNENALTDTAKKNEAVINYSNYEQKDDVQYDTSATGMIKFDGDKAEVVNDVVQLKAQQTGTYLLPNAEFKLQVKNGAAWEDMSVVQETGYYRPMNGTETAATIKSDNNGEVIIRGLDSDKQYQLIETKVPADGYNLATAPVALTLTLDSKAGVTISDAESETVTKLPPANVGKLENKKGSQLPSTGGMGTTLFYVIGSVLVIGAAVLLVVRRRMNEE